MFDLGWTEMLLIGVVALVVVGPKELPALFRGVGQAVGKARGMAREFSRAMEAAADEAGVKDIDRTIRAATRPVQFGADRLRDAAGIGRTAPRKPAAVPAAGTPLDPGPAMAPIPRPAPQTEALAARRAAERAALARASAERSASASARTPAPAPAPAASPAPEETV